MSTLSLFLVLGGVSYAAVTLPRNSVGSRQLRTGAVTGSKVRDGSLTSADIAGGLLAGAKGDTGAAGPAGADGQRGPTGAAGSAGGKGDTGAAGMAGTAGPSGAKGPTGATGAKGDTGAAGAKGDTGTAGAKGDTGTAGAKGDTGTAGAKGDTGGTGAKGDTGPTGDTGPAGPTGAAGPTGPSGVVVSGSYSGVISTITANSSAFVFANSSAYKTVTLTGSERIIAGAQLNLSTNTGTANNVAIDMCYRKGGTLKNFQAGDVGFASIDSTTRPYATTAAVAPGAGTYDVGPCILNNGTAALAGGNEVAGWVLVASG